MNLEQLEKRREYYWANRDRLRANQRRSWHKHAEKRKAESRAASKIRVAALKREMVDSYGSKCECCGEAEIEFLSIEHKNHDGKEHRREVGGGQLIWKDLKKRGWPKDGYGILCYNCNLATRFRRTCPHRRSL